MAPGYGYPGARSAFPYGSPFANPSRLPSTLQSRLNPNLSRELSSFNELNRPQAPGAGRRFAESGKVF
jgi:hypothetical protein